MESVAEAYWTFACELNRSFGTTSIERHYVQIIPDEPDRVLKVESVVAVVRETIDRRQRFSQCECRSASVFVVIEGVQYDLPRRALDGESKDRRGVEKQHVNLADPGAQDRCVSRPTSLWAQGISTRQFAVVQGPGLRK